jgi:hypothetical protein
MPLVTPTRACARDSQGIWRFLSRAWEAVSSKLCRPHLVRFGATETPEWLQGAMNNPLARDSLRGHLATLRAGADFEFLLSYWAFHESKNALQRFQLLAMIIHRFVRDNAARPIKLTEGCRTAAMSEWASWQVRDRCPPGTQLPALESAAIEVHDFVSKHGPLSPLALAQLQTDAGRSE